MPLIRCKIGYAETYILGTTYTFQADAAGRFVCHVPVDRHVELLLSAGTYEEVGTLPIGALLDRDADILAAIRTELLAAVDPSFVNTAADGEPPAIALAAPWPPLVAIDVADMVENGVPDFITIDPNDRLIVTVTNAAARYGLKGTADGKRLYELLEGSTYEPLAAADEAPKPDDLTRITGIGKATASKLAEAGTTSFAQIAAWTAEDVARIDAALKLHGAITRDKWIEQATALLPATPAT